MSARPITGGQAGCLCDRDGVLSVNAPEETEDEEGTVCPASYKKELCSSTLHLLPSLLSLSWALPWGLSSLRGKDKEKAVQGSWSWQERRGGGDSISSPTVTLWGKEGGSQRGK